MAVLVDFDDEGDDPHVDHHDAGLTAQRPQHLATASPQHPEHSSAEQRPNPNVNGFSAALGCYPVVTQLASHLDLNSLDDLSRTCRQVRANLLQYRNQLVKLTLRCGNEPPDAGLLPADGISKPRQHVHNAERTNNWPEFGRLTSGKVGRCARDSVGECRRCGTVVCRNCIAKPPSPVRLNDRHRRLCVTCGRSPLEYLMTLTPPKKTRSSTSGTGSSSTSTSTSPSPPSSVYSLSSDDESDPDTHHVDPPKSSRRTPCTCAEEVWFCQPCGANLRTNDAQYRAGWTWRSTYSYIGGFGAGIGEGIEGVICGRGARCLAMRTVEKELECTADELAAMQSEADKAEAGGRSWRGTSYMAQEIVGVGGVVKKKVKKKEKLGASVRKYEDEKEQGEYLGREKKGIVRSWCSWCERVIPGQEDLATGLKV